MKYSKPPLTIDEQIELLVSRGLDVPNKEKAKNFLKSVNYYRFSGYCLPFERTRHDFVERVKFEDIVNLYEFDSQLRHILDIALERIEIYLKTNLAYILAHKYGAFAHEKSENFFSNFEHVKFIEILREETEKSREIFIKHHKNTYKEFPQLPIWVVVEIISFRCISTLIKYGLKKEDRLEISKIFKLHSKVFCSWIHSISYIRNVCAHHLLLWNRNLSIKMSLPKNDWWKNFQRHKTGTVIMIVNTLLSNYYDQSFISDWQKEIENLIDNHSDVPHFWKQIGLPENWKENPVWRGK